MTRVLRVYADPSHYADVDRKALTDICKAAWNTASLEERRQTYGRVSDRFEVVSSPDAAELHLLTMRWQHYVERGRVDQARRAVDLARRAKRPIAVFSYGDFEANFPIEGRDIHVFQLAGYRSRRTTSQHGMPAFFDDPLANAPPLLRDHARRPVVGFCGQAGASLPRHAVRYVRGRIRWLRWRLGHERWEPAPLEHTWFRHRILDAFEKSPLTETRFVLRTRYRAGVRSNDRSDSAQQTRREFVQNVLDTDYTVCVRGGGNFSVRFYEALAMARIPAFIDTDCLLPFREHIDWRGYTSWIEEADAMSAPKIVATSHARMSAAEYRERQLAARALWQERLTPHGFYSHFHEHFPELQ